MTNSVLWTSYKELALPVQFENMWDMQGTDRESYPFQADSIKGDGPQAQL